MIQGQDIRVDPSADQLVRRLYQAVGRLQTTYIADLDELKRLREERQRRISTAERTAREESNVRIASSSTLAGKRSLGSDLRNELAQLVSIKHADPGPLPGSFGEAVTEWKSLAATGRRLARDFRNEMTNWNSKLIKRAKHMPQAGDELWRSLDRLDLIHRAIQPLAQAWIADVVREAAAAADVMIETEVQRQAATCHQLAQEVNDAIAAVQAAVGLAGTSWTDPRWSSPEPAAVVEHFIRLGELQAALPPGVGVAAVPALVEFPFTSGMAIGSGITHREAAVGLVRAILLRSLAAVPPGGLHVKAIDPISLGQSVAEFRHLSDFDSRLMDEKTWTSERDIERLMDDLSDHLQLVISKYLRGQFESIDEYNKNAGEVAQPYRVVAVFDYPTGFSDRASKQLLSLIENGTRCGVYVLLHYDTTSLHGDRHEVVPASRLIHAMQRVTFGDGAGVDGILDLPSLELSEPNATGTLRLLADGAPPISFDGNSRPTTGFAQLLQQVGLVARRTLEKPAAVTLDSLLPVLGRSQAGVLPDYAPHADTLTTDPRTWWRASTKRTAVAPIGRSGVQGVVSMYFSSTEVAGGAIMVGLPRSGKTTSLHSLIMTLSMLYSPDELELYLIDAKHGVEFKVYERLPHARMVSIRSEREFSLAVLQSIEREVQLRAERMKAHGGGLANITEYREATGERLPRIVVVIDEFHELFEEPDSIGMAAFSAFSNIVRMGPFSGAHLVVASQTLSNMPAMDRPTLTLLPQRVAFMCNEYDSEIVMGDTNKAPRLLTKTGEGLFNPARGEESRNQPFQGLYIPTEERAAILRSLERIAVEYGWTRRPRVFDGDAVVERPERPATVSDGQRLIVPIGEPFSLTPVETMSLPRSRGGNLVILGDGPDEDAVDLAARGAIHSVMLAAQAHGVQTTVVDFIGGESTAAALSVMDVAASAEARYARSRALESILDELATLVGARGEAADYRAPTKLLVLNGIQRALALKPADSFGYGDEESNVGSQLATILTQGPEVGVHVVVCADGTRALETRVGSEALTELAMRVGGSSADQKDLAFVAGSYGDVAPLRFGQLLLGDLLKGSVRRVRGYRPLTSLTSQDQEIS